MKFPEYMPELICFLLFTFFSSLWVISLKEDEATRAQLSPLLALDKLIPKHEVQLLNANFSDQLHYDQLAQLQSEVETLISDVNVRDTSEKLLKDYKEMSLSYIQLSSMLKTSLRLISEPSRFEEAQLTDVIDSIRLEMFSFVSAPGRTDKVALMEILNSIDTDNKQQTNWQDLQLVKLHSLFVLDNYELTATYRQKLIGMPVIETISQEQSLLQQQIRTTNIKQFAGIVGTILSLLSLFFVVIKRHVNELKKTSSQHQEFATSLMDMLGPDIKKTQARRNHHNKDGEKPMQIKKRK